MDKTRTADLLDTKVEVRVALCGLWITTLFVAVYIDIFGLWRADVINGILVREVHGTGFEIDQTFLILTTTYMMIPIMMVAVSLLAPARVNRMANMVVALAYLTTVLVTIIGETWIYYIVGMVVQAMLLAVIARVAWTWPRSPVR